MASHKKILTKKQIAKLRTFYWDYLHLPHEHYGFETSKTTDFLLSLGIKFCEKKQFINHVDKINPFFRDQFLITMVSPILQSFKTKYYKVRQDDGSYKNIKNKWFLRGFECEKIGMHYHYYYPRPGEELNRIITRDETLVESKKINFEIRAIERGEYIKFLPGHVPPDSLKEHASNDRDKDVA